MCWIYGTMHLPNVNSFFKNTLNIGFSKKIDNLFQTTPRLQYKQYSSVLYLILALHILSGCNF